MNRNAGPASPEYAGIDPYAAAPKAVCYFSAWDGLLTGFYMRQ